MARAAVGDGGHVDRERAVIEAVDRPLLAEQDLLDLRGVRDHGDHGGRALGGLARRRGGPGAVLAGEASAFSLVRVYTESSKPAPARFAAIGPPMMPRPQKAFELTVCHIRHLRGSRSAACLGRRVPDAFGGSSSPFSTFLPGAPGSPPSAPGGACLRRSVIQREAHPRRAPRARGRRRRRRGGEPSPPEPRRSEYSTARSGNSSSSASTGVLRVFDIATCTPLGPSASGHAPCRRRVSRSR